MSCAGQISAFVTAAANLLAEKFTDEELAVLATALTQLGDTLGTILAYRALLDSCASKGKGNAQCGRRVL